MDVINMVERMKHPAIWTHLFLPIVIFFLIIVYLVFFVIGQFVAVDFNALNYAIAGGVISGGILIIFDIIFGKGIAQDEIRREQRMMFVVQDAINSDEVRRVIREEIRKELQH